MRIRGWSIDGFGHFCGEEVAGVEDGLTVFYGPNEAGKSTLLAFIRGMLFGFPDRRAREPRYEPLRGGRHGGRLLLDVDGERWTVERDASARGAGVRVFTPRGEGSEEDLRRALGSADTRLFRSVFAFSLTELQSFATLNDDEARSRIFSAGVVGAGRAARQVINELGEQADALFKPRGRTQRIPTLLRQLGEQHQATVAARRAARAYPDLVREEDACLAEQQRLTAAVAHARREARRYDGLLGHWSVWSDLQDAEAQHAALEAIEAFPPDPERRLAETGSHLEAAQTRLADARRELELAAARVLANRTTVHDALSALAPEVTAHDETRGVYRDVVRRLHAARADAAYGDDALVRALGDLGEEWSEERLAAFDVSLPQRDRLRGWSERLRRVADDTHLAEREHAAAQHALRVAERDVEQTIEALRTVPTPDAARLDATEAVLRRLRGRLAERRDHEHQVAQRRAVWEERQHALRLLESQAEPEEGTPAMDAAGATSAADAGNGSGDGLNTDGGTPATQPSGGHARRSTAPAADDAGSAVPPAGSGGWLLPFAIGAFGLLVAGLIARTRPVLGAVSALGAVLLAVGVAAWLRRVRLHAARTAAAERQAASARVEAVERAAAAARRADVERLAAADRAAVSRRRAHETRLTAAQEHVANAQEAVAHAQRALEAVTAAIGSEVGTLGLAEPPTGADLDDVERAVLQQRQQMARVEQLRHTLAEAESHRAERSDQAATAGRRLDEAGQATDAAQREWAEWATARGISNGMPPESALDFVPAVERARGLLHARDKGHAALNALAAEVHAWESRAVQLLERAGQGRADWGSDHDAGALVDALHRLHDRCVADRTARERLATAEADRHESGTAVAAAEAEMRRHEEAWVALLAEAGAENEAQYRQRMHIVAERERLRREIERLRRQLAGRIGDGPDADAVRAALATGAVGEWERERDRHEHDAGADERLLEQAIRAHQDAQRRREALELSADIARCEADEQSTRTELHAAVEQWRTVALAKALTEVTLQEYVRTRQPAVVAQASGMFAAITNGAYPELRQDESGEGLLVVPRRGGIVSPEQLSRGTAEQLYLCLRLGLAAEFGAHGAQLPLVMDDVCVNFDPERARAVAAVLGGHAGGQQIIFFTCHPTTVDLLRDAVPGLRVHDMPRHGLRGPPGEPDAAAV